MLCLVLGSAQLFALNPRKALTQYTRTTWTQADGLPQDTIRAITQTHDGYLWLGTDEGLARFDGYDFVIYTKNDGALPSNSITALWAGQSGALWIGTPNGLARYVNRQFTTFTTKDGLPDNSITSLVEDHTGVLWIAAGVSLCRFENGKFSTYPSDRLAPLDVVREVYEDRSHQLWVAGLGGVVKRTGDGFSPVLGPKETDGIFITSMLKDRNNGFWIAGSKGLILRKPDGTLRRFDSHDGLPDNLVRALWEDSAGNLWAGTNGGLSRLENGRFVSPALGGEDERGWVRCLFEDREGNLWVGMNSGLDRLRDDRFTTYGRSEGLPSDEPIAVHQDAKGQIWVGYHDAGLIAFLPGGFHAYTTRDGLASNEIFGIRESHDGDLLIATRSGLSRMHEGRFNNSVVNDPLGRTIVFDILEDSRGRLLVATPSGVNELIGRTSRNVIPGGPVVNEFPVVLSEGSDGSLWAGTYGSGLWQIKDANSKPRLYTTADGLGSDQIRSLYRDSEGTLWIGTFGGGLNSLRNGAFSRFTTRDGLLSDNISHVEDDGRGNLWLSTTRGICRVAKQQLRDFAAGRIKVLTPEVFGVEDGLRSAQAAPGFPTGGGGARTSDGRLWFPTSRGLATIDPNAPVQGARTPLAQLIEIAADGQQVDFSRFEKLKPGIGHIQFRYTGIYLSAPERVRYAYKLEGLDRDWIPAAGRRLVNYNTLPHGRYRFAVMASLPGQGSNESSFSFEVLPHFYETAWFVWLCVASFLAAIYGLYQLRLTQIRSRFSLVLDERVRLAREIHDTLAQGFVGISSQLDALALKLNGDLGVVRQHLDLARKMARHSLTEARRSVMDLRTSALEDHDLPSALTTAAREWAAGSPVQVQVEVSGNGYKLSEDVEQHLLRIAQEAVTNALKHAGARMIRVELAVEDRKLRLRVKDDGRGFEPSRAFSVIGGHFGILGMRERAERLGGELDLSSQLGLGTQVEVTVPLS